MRRATITCCCSTTVLWIKFQVSHIARNNDPNMSVSCFPFPTERQKNRKVIDSLSNKYAPGHDGATVLDVGPEID